MCPSVTLLIITHHLLNLKFRQYNLFINPVPFFPLHYWSSLPLQRLPACLVLACNTYSCLSLSPEISESQKTTDSFLVFLHESRVWWQPWDLMVLFMINLPWTGCPDAEEMRAVHYIEILPYVPFLIRDKAGALSKHPHVLFLSDVLDSCPLRGFKSLSLG